VVAADFLDGMEYDGLFFLGRGFYNTYNHQPDDYLIAITVHETAHQWWYGLVGNDQAIEPWLDEALCTYSEAIFYEQYYPQSLASWWARRIHFYQPTGYIGQPIYAYGGFVAYRDAAYLRGAQFFEALRRQIGDEAFFAFLKDYATQGAGQIVTRQDFFDILAQHTHEDLSSLVAEYFAVP
jgi:aminopeptidase N